jgi:hypothetical protein
MHSLNTETPKLWIQDIVTKIGKTQIGQFIISSETSNSEDGLTEAVKSSKPSLIVRESFRILLDRFFFCCYTFIYIFMFKKLMPDEFRQ